MIENRSQNRFGRVILLALMSLGSTVEASTWVARVPLIEKKLMEAFASYRKGDIKLAKRHCDDAYFGVFEDIEANMEVAIRKSVSMTKAAELEELFGRIRKQFSTKASEKDILDSIKTLVIGVSDTAQTLDKDKVSLKQ